MKRALLLTACLLLLVAVASLALINPDAPPGGDPLLTPSPELAHDSGTGIQGEARDRPTDNESGKRVEVDEPARAAEPASNVQLVVSGRVVDHAGNSVPAAKVEVFTRRGWESLFGQGRGFSPPRNADWEKLLLQRKLAAPVVTNDAGEFTVEGQAFRESELRVAVQHASFAPRVVSRTWRAEEGTARLEDIVVTVGGSVSGYVVDEHGRGVAEAEVTLNTVRGGGMPRRGRGGRPRFDRGEILDGLYEPIQTDESGAFRFEHLPAESFVLTAKASPFLPGASPRISAKDGQELDEQKIELASGVALRGVVLNAESEPIADAEVAVRTSRTAWQSMLEGFKINFAPQANQINQLRNITSRMSRPRLAEQYATTNAAGEFFFEAVPKTAIRLTIRHDDHIEADRDPVEAIKTPELEIRMDRRLAVAGIVVDGQTQSPIEVFGIEARRTGRGNFSRGDTRGRRGGRGGPERQIRQQLSQLEDLGRQIRVLGVGRQAELLHNRQQRTPRTAQQAEAEALKKAERQARDEQRRAERQARDAARRAEREADRAREAAYRQQRLGASGQAPRSTPEPSTHPGGTFRLDKLDPGEYVLDVSAPGFVATAWGPFSIEPGQTPDPVTVQLERGNVISGMVTARGTGEAVADARVSLYLPPLDPPSTGNAPGAPFGRGRGGPRGGRGVRVAEVRTSPTGAFSFGSQRPGTYQLRVTADDHVDTTLPNLLVQAGEDLAGLQVEIGRGSRVHGRVRGLEYGQRARVTFRHENGKTETANTDTEDHAYEIVGLIPGGHYVNAELIEDGGGGRRDWRRMMSASLRQQAGEPADLMVVEGGDRRHDLIVDGAFGTLTGVVSHNFQPAEKLEVRLQIDANASAGAPANPGAERALRAIGRMLRDRTDGDGGFEISRITPGNYKLEVRRTGRNSRVLYREDLVVVRGDQLDRRIEILTGALELEVRDSTNAKLVRDARFTMVLAAEAGNRQPKQWKGLRSLQSHRTKNGRLELDEVTAGEYLFYVSSSRNKGKLGQLSITAGVPVNLPIQLEPRPAKKSSSGAGKPKR